MKVPTRNRAELKSYFVKNSIPTESNFAELIDGMINQQEDGVVKLPEEPLSIEAAGDATSEKNVIRFYRDFENATPDWTLSLNPRMDPDDSNSATPGLNISDGEGNSRLFIDRSTGNVGINTMKPKSSLEVAGIIKAQEFETTNPNMLRHRIYPANPLVYQDIFEAEEKGAIAKLGSPLYNNHSYPRSKPWRGHPIIAYGGNSETDGNGARVTIPEGYDTVWLRVLGERWNVVKAYLLDGEEGIDLGQWTGGYRSANCFCPDGSLSDGVVIKHKYNNTDNVAIIHQWMPIPAGRAGELALISKPSTSSYFWLSGLAFSQNPWAHASQSAVGYHWAVNGGDKTVWEANWENWKGDSLSKILVGTNSLLKVPVRPSGRDKLLYLIEHNNDWNGAMHSGITINGNEIERFTASYDNPFARHWNSKFYERYLAARIPAELIPEDTRYLDVRIDLTKQFASGIKYGIYFREIGTHDLEVPLVSTG
jgi:hypothetical protein